MKCYLYIFLFLTYKLLIRYLHLKLKFYVRPILTSSHVVAGLPKKDLHFWLAERSSSDSSPKWGTRFFLSQLATSVTILIPSKRKDFKAIILFAFRFKTHQLAHNPLKTRESSGHFHERCPIGFTFQISQNHGSPSKDFTSHSLSCIWIKDFVE